MDESKLGSDSPALVLWAWPRTRSTVFERFFLARESEDVEVLHEPLSAPVYWSDKRVSPIWSDEACQSRWKHYADATFESVWHDMTHAPPGKKAVFTKDMAKDIVEQEVAKPGSIRPPDFAKDGNPTYLPTEHLLAGNLKHVFLIRSPEESVPSWARLGRLPDIGCGYFSSPELGIRQSAKLYRFLESRLEEPPPVIDSDDIFEYSEEIVRKLCDMLNIDYQPCMLVWPDSPVVKELFGKWQGWREWTLSMRGSKLTVR